jgi:hypothetical protein
LAPFAALSVAPGANESLQLSLPRPARAKYFASAKWGFALPSPASTRRQPAVCPAGSVAVSTRLAALTRVNNTNSRRLFVAPLTAQELTQKIAQENVSDMIEKFLPRPEAIMCAGIAAHQYSITDAKLANYHSSIIRKVGAIASRGTNFHCTVTFLPKSEFQSPMMGFPHHAPRLRHAPPAQAR